MDDLLGLALSPIVSCAAPVSRPLASSANSPLQKYSADRIQLPIVLDFQSDKGREEIREWYHKQPTTGFTHIEHRKETTGRFGHEFVVIRLVNSTACRFDRRAREDMRGHALKDEGTISEDSAHVITQADTESKARLDESEVLLSTNLVWGKDINLEFILAMCCEIQSHPAAKSYSLLHYNCYFFSWTLVTIIDHQARQQRVRKSYSIKLSADDWIAGFYDLLSQEMVVFGLHWQKESLWKRVTRLGQSIIGANSHQRSLILRVDKFIHEGMKRELGDHFSKRLDINLNKLLFPSQIPSWLNKQVSSALQEGGRLGVQQFLAETNAHSQINNKLSAPIHPRKVDSGEERLDGSASSVVDVGHIYQSLDERARWKAETEWKRYEKIIDTFIANSSKLKMWSNACWPPSNVVHKHVTERMGDHFKQTEGYGFGKAEPSIERAKDSMAEIWVSILDMMEDKSELSFL
ncbi:hypothetical protein V565_243210 [Rhizoctonia solani 123E]|uniref:Uncharacterized protein n=1 Tax=Rhizoctonia solani 123E TaxID=1423351 RepID=A0A074RGA1_9AGAM|nr:hypothetical protein V565_243210 [Rhizoctonia solani 123E]